MPSTSQVSFASQNGPIEATMRSCSSRVGRRHQHADAEVVAVEHHVGEDRDAHQHGEDERQVSSLSCLHDVAFVIGVGLALAGEVGEHDHVGDEQHARR